VTGIDPIDRLAVLAAALPGAVVRERRIAAPFEAVWRVVADLEGALPRYEPGVAQVRVTERDGEYLRVLVRDTAGGEEAMDARLRPGWCLMQSGTIVVAFAARRLGDATLLAHLEHRRPPAEPYGPGAGARLDRELRTIEELAAPGA